MDTTGHVWHRNPTLARHPQLLPRTPRPSADVRDARGSAAPLGSAVEREAAIHTVSFLSIRQDERRAERAPARLESRPLTGARRLERSSANVGNTCERLSSRAFDILSEQVWCGQWVRRTCHTVLRGGVRRTQVSQTENVHPVDRTVLELSRSQASRRASVGSVEFVTRSRSPGHATSHSFTSPRRAPPWAPRIPRR